MTTRPSVLFLCTGNACRSQMAEGFTRAMWGDAIKAFSAGVEARGLDPRAVTVMAEAGVDIASARSKTVDALPGVAFDLVVTLCGHARDTCPYLPGAARRLHVGFDDPPSLAEGAPNEAAALDHYRTVRDAIREFVRGLPGLLASDRPAGR